MYIILQSEGSLKSLDNFRTITHFYCLLMAYVNKSYKDGGVTPEEQQKLLQNRAMVTSSFKDCVEFIKEIFELENRLIHRRMQALQVKQADREPTPTT